MVRLILELLLLYIVVTALRRFLGGFSQGLSGSKGRPTHVQATNLARDPICGTYVVPAQALSASKGKETRFFCSDKCRQAWVTR
jgi:YHS domain-containing protein